MMLCAIVAPRQSMRQVRVSKASVLCAPGIPSHGSTLDIMTAPAMQCAIAYKWQKYAQRRWFQSLLAFMVYAALNGWALWLLNLEEEYTEVLYPANHRPGYTNDTMVCATRFKTIVAQPMRRPQSSSDVQVLFHVRRCLST